MNNMINMAASMDMDEMNKNMQNMAMMENARKSNPNVNAVGNNNMNNISNMNVRVKSAPVHDIVNNDKNDKPHNVHKMRSVPDNNNRQQSHDIMINNGDNPYQNIQSEHRQYAMINSHSHSPPKPKSKPKLKPKSKLKLKSNASDPYRKYDSPSPPPSRAMVNKPGYGYNKEEPKQKPQRQPQPPPAAAQAIGKNEPIFDNPIQSELVSMGFDHEYVTRACNLYRKKFKNKPFRLEVLTEIIIRLQQRDKNKNRAKSIASVDSEHKERDKLEKASQLNHVKRRSSFQGFGDNAANYAPLQQSVSQNYDKYNYDNKNNQYKTIKPVDNNVNVEIIMSTSSIGSQKCDIVIRKDQTLSELKQLISTCLLDFDQFDQCYAFFHDNSGFIFTEFDITMLQALQLMDINGSRTYIYYTQNW